MRISLLALSIMGLCALAPSAEAQTAPRIGVAAAVRNQVTGTMTGQAARPLAVGAGVFQDELISTGASSVAQLLFSDQTTLSVGPRSEVRLDRYVYDPNRSVGDVAVSATTGALRFISGSQDPHSYQVRTPVATVGVRGTIVDFLIMDGRMFGILDEGRVLYTLPNGEVIEVDEPGQAVEFYADGTASRPFTWRGRYEAGQRVAAFPLFGNPFADMRGWEGANNLDDSINRTDELYGRDIQDLGDNF